MSRRFGPFTVWRLLAVLSLGAAFGAGIAGYSDGEGLIVAMWMMGLYLLLLLVDWVARTYGGSEG